MSTVGREWAGFLPEPMKSDSADLMWVAAFVAAVTALWRSPVLKPVRWSWERLVTDPRRERRQADITAAMRPMVDELRASAKSEHEAQNEILREHGDRLDRGAEAIDGLRVSVAEIRGKVGLPRDPESKTRRDDQ